MNREKLQQIQGKLQDIPFADYPLHSRVHKLNAIPNCEHTAYVKRDDELSCGVSGSKKRKYASLIPYLQQQNIQNVFVIGSAYSNNVLSACQLLCENRIKPTLFLLGSKAPEELLGNHLLINLFVEPSHIHWIARSDWPCVQDIAENYGKKCSEDGINTFLLQEGASNKEALPGALTLGFDLIENEREIGIEFQHILVDAGTGLTAAALILFFSFIEKQTTVHVLLLAQTKQEFIHQLMQWKEILENLLCCKMPHPQNFVLHLPSLARSFGSMNSTVLQSIKATAKNEGILTDPIYSAKLFLEAAKIFTPHQNQNCLLLHSGGAFTLSGFQKQFAKIVS